MTIKKSRIVGQKRTNKPRLRAGTTCGIESLEDRRMMAVVSVSNANDLVNAPDTSSIAAIMNDDGGDGISLREAITAANNTAGADTVTFGSLFGTPQAIRLTQSSELSITESLSIDASAAAGNVAIRGNDSRILHFTSTSGDLTVQGLTIEGGSANRVPRGGGGLRFNSAGTLAIVDSTIRNNGSGLSTANGGAVFSAVGTVFVTGSTISGNQVFGNGAKGGGIGTGSGDITLVNSTVSGNSNTSTGLKGGGIYTASGNVRIINSTVTGNSSGAGGGISIGNSSTNPLLQIHNSIVAGNASTGTAADLVVDPDSTLDVKYSLIGDATGTSLNESQTGDPAGNLVGTTVNPINSRLSALTFNGGSTQTHGLLAGSPAMNAGDPDFNPNSFSPPLASDQRGAGIDRVLSGRVDIGAFEVQSHDFTSPAVASVPENTISVHQLTTPDPAVTFSIVGAGADNGKFEIANGNQLNFVTAPNAEAPTDVGRNNIYEVSVSADDGNGGVSPQVIQVSVTPVNEHAPVVTTPSAASVSENVTSVLALTATDADHPAQSITFSIEGSGADNAKFEVVNGNELKFAAEPDFEAPTDVGGTAMDNVYEVSLKADDGSGLIAQEKTISISVTPANDNAPVFSSPVIANVFERTSTVHTLTATDADLPTQLVTFSIAGSGADNEKFQVVNGTELQFIASPDFENPIDAGGTAGDNIYEVSVLANDGNGLTTPQTIQVTVANLAEFSVDSIADVSDGNTTPGNLALREAIELANAETGSAVIDFAPLFDTPQTIALASQLPTITNSVTIIGKGPDLLTIDAGNGTDNTFNSGDGFRHLVIDDGDANKRIDVRLAGLTLVGGDFGDLMEGGAINSSENLTLIDSVVANNTARKGGGIYHGGGSLNIINSRLSGNRARDGGGLVSSSFTTVTGSIVSDNVGSTGGGGIRQNRGSLIVRDSTISGNRGGGGGGIGLFTTLGALINSTVSGNYSSVYGGGILRLDSSLAVDSSTITNNSTSGYGGGVSHRGNSGDLTIRNSIIAGNTDNGTAPDVLQGQRGRVTASFSLIGDTTGSLITTANGNVVNQAAGIGPLADNGGPTHTHALLPGSAAIDMGDPNLDLSSFAPALRTDQRGSIASRVGSGRVDLGAFEVQPHDFNSPRSVSVAENSTSVQRLATHGSPVTFSTSGTGADNSKFEITNGNQLTFSAAPDFETPTDANSDNVYEVSVKAEGVTGLAAVQAVRVTVTPLNDNSPVFTSPAATNVAENTTAVHALTATDADLPAQAITYSFNADGADNAKFEIINGNELKFVTAPDFEALADIGGTAADNIYEVSVQAEDAAGMATVQAILVTVDPVNENSPVFASPASANVPENTTTVHSLTATDTDLPVQAITHSISGSGADNALFEIVGDELRFKSAPDFENPTDAGGLAGDNIYEVSVQAEDVVGLATAQTILVTVDPVNDNAPVFTSSVNASVTENNTAVHTLTATDGDLPSQSISYAIAGNGFDNDQFEIIGNELRFKSAPNFEAPADADTNNVYQVNVQVGDGSGMQNSQLIQVSVIDENEAPKITSPAVATVAENTPFVHSLTAIDEDLPAQPITYKIEGSGTDSDKFEIVGGEIRFKSAPNFESPTDTFGVAGDNVYQVTVQAADVAGLATVQAIQVTVTDTGEPLRFTSPANVAVAENTVLAHSLSATDDDAPLAPVTFQFLGIPDGGDILGPGRSLAVDQTIRSANGEYRLILQGDGNLVVYGPGRGSSWNTFTTIGSGASRIEMRPDGNLVMLAGSNVVWESGSSTDPDSMAHLKIENDGRLTINRIDGAKRWETVVFRNSRVANVLDVGPLDRQFLNANDNSKFVLVGNELRFRQAPNFEAPTDVVGTPGDNVYQVSITANDRNGQSVVQDIQVTITDANDPPTFNSPTTATVVENTLTVHSLAATDVDQAAQTLTYSLVGNAADNDKFELVDGELRFKSAPDFENPTDVGGTAGDNVYQLMVQVEDGNGGVAQQTIDVSVTGANDNGPLFASPTTATVPENSLTVHPLVATDADRPGDSLTFQVGRETLPSDLGPGGILRVGQSIRSADGTATLLYQADRNLVLYKGGVDVWASGRPSGTHTGSDRVEMQADGNLVIYNGTNIYFQSGSSSDAGSAAILRIENNGQLAIHRGDGARLWESTSHGNGRVLPVGALPNGFEVGADNGRFEIVDNELRFKTAPNFEMPTDAFGAVADNVYQVSVLANDGAGALNAQAIQVTVVDVDEPVRFTTPSSIRVLEGTAAILTPTAIDEDSPNATISYWVGSGGDRQAQFRDGVLHFNTAPDFENPTDIVRTPNDNVYEIRIQAAIPGAGLSGITDQTIFVTVVDVDEPLRFTSPESASVAENTTTIHTLVASDDELPGQAVTYSLSTGGTDNDKFTIVGDQLQFIAAPDFENPTDLGGTVGDNVYEIIVQSNDAAGQVATQAIAITVTGVNEHAPVFTSPNAVSVNTQYVMQLSATDQDLPVGPIRYQIGGNGPDNDKFQLINGRGENDLLVFRSTPDFVEPGDANGDNAYEVTVQARGNANIPELTATQTVMVTLTGPVASPRNLVVDVTTDLVDGNFSAGNLSLREAILIANLDVATAEMITFSPTVFSTPQTITLANNRLPTIEAPVTIAGPGANLVTVSGKYWGPNQSANGMLNIRRHRDIPAPIDVSISGLSLVDGNNDGPGAAIRSNENLTLTGVSISNNSRTPVANAGGKLNVIASTISNNVGNGGSINGGAINNTGTLHVTNSTLSGNSATRGGAIWNSGSAAVNNSTVTANSSTTSGGGILSTGNVEINNSIIAGNTANSIANNLSGTGTFLGNYNLLGAGLNTSGADNITGVENPMLGPLANHGGATLTHALLTDSPAIDAGNPAFNPNSFTPPVTNDQRQAGFPRIDGVRVDIGAVERKTLTAPRVETVAVDDGSAQRSMVRSLTVTFDKTVTTQAGAFTVLNTTTNTRFAPTATTESSNGKTQVTLTFEGAQIIGGSLPDGNYTLTVNREAVSSSGTPMSADHATEFYRFFGEINGDRSVLGTDFRAFVGSYRKSLGDPGYSAYFDVNGDDAVLGTDFRTFVGNYRKSLPAPGTPSNSLDPAIEIGVDSVQIDTGTGQRSMVRDLHVTFNSLVEFDEAAFSVRDGDGTPVSMDVTSTVQAGKTVVTLTFNDPELIAGSLADGEYTLSIDRTKVFRDDFVEMLNDYSLTFHRLFGDHDANRLVDNVDREFFDIVRELASNPNETAPDLFDKDGDSDIDGVDELAMQNAMGNSLRKPGDANFDGKVNFDDFMRLARNFGAIDAVWGDGDFNDDGEVGFADFLLLSASFELDN